jgi:hypothetical protein
MKSAGNRKAEADRGWGATPSKPHLGCFEPSRACQARDDPEAAALCQ